MDSFHESGASAGGPSSGTEPSPALQARLDSLYAEGREIWNRFDAEVRRRSWHPFIPADYRSVQRALVPMRAAGLRFLEWGSATGVITIMADMLGFEAYGIELDADLVAIARRLAVKRESGARFAAGSYLPAGYEWTSPTGDRRLGTIGEGVPGYAEIQRSLDSFDIVFGYPWTGEAPVMHDVFLRHGGEDARLLLLGAESVEVYHRGRRVA